jgi:hypothetical protein
VGGCSTSYSLQLCREWIPRQLDKSVTRHVVLVRKQPRTARRLGCSHPRAYSRPPRGMSAATQNVPWTSPYADLGFREDRRRRRHRAGHKSQRELDCSYRMMKTPQSIRSPIFWPGNIAKISGYRPAMVKAAAGGNVSIRLVTLGHGQTLAAIAAAMRGQWDSYRIVTVSRRHAASGWSARIRAAPHLQRIRFPKGLASIPSTSGRANSRGITIRWCSGGPTEFWPRMHTGWKIHVYPCPSAAPPLFGED